MTTEKEDEVPVVSMVLNKDLKKRRKELREKLLQDLLLNENTPTVYQAEYNGGGDSGNFNVNTCNEEVDALFIAIMEKYINFDWYNNEGGGGEIQWNITTDELELTGHYYVQETVDVPTQSF